MLKWVLIVALALPGIALAGDVDPRCIVYLRTETHSDRAVGVWAEATLEATPARVYQTLLEFEHYPQYLPRVLRSEKRPGERVFTELKAPWPLRNIWFIARIEKARRAGALLLRWAMEKGNIRRNDGQWSVRSLPAGGSRLRYEGIVEVYNILPPALLRLAEEYELPRIVQAIRKRVAGENALLCKQTVMQRL